MNNFFKKCKKLDIYSFDMSVKQLTDSDKKFILKNIKNCHSSFDNIDNYNSIVIHVEREDFFCYESPSYNPSDYSIFKKLIHTSLKNKLK